MMGGNKLPEFNLRDLSELNIGRSPLEIPKALLSCHLFDFDLITVDPLEGPAGPQRLLYGKAE